MVILPERKTFPLCEGAAARRNHRLLDMPKMRVQQICPAEAQGDLKRVQHPTEESDKRVAERRRSKALRLNEGRDTFKEFYLPTEYSSAHPVSTEASTSACHPNKEYHFGQSGRQGPGQNLDIYFQRPGSNPGRCREAAQGV